LGPRSLDMPIVRRVLLGVSGGLLSAAVLTLAIKGPPHVDTKAMNILAERRKQDLERQLAPASSQ